MVSLREKIVIVNFTVFCPQKYMYAVQTGKTRFRWIYFIRFDG